jgi:ATP-dependent Clp protease ATP-binding subunit ClpB
VILLDEIEKAHPDVFNILLQVLDDGRLTDNKGRVVNFKNILVILTSNIGSYLIQENLANLDENNSEMIQERTRQAVFEQVKKTFRPEFLNRVDEMILFTPLTKTEVRDIVRLQFQQIMNRLEDNEIKVHLTDQATDLIAELGYDPQYGARPIKRIIQKLILNELSKQILEERIVRNQEIRIDANKEGITITAIPAGGS